MSVCFFLEESWKYAREEHCGQHETLKFVPLPPPQLIAKKNAEYLIVELKSSMINPLPSTIIAIICTIVCLEGMNLNSYISVFIGLIWGILTIFLSSAKKVRRFLGTGGSEVRIFENYIEINEQKYRWNEIRAISSSVR